MSKDFFIMLRNGDKAMPIVDENEEVMLYESKLEAIEAMKGHIYAEAYGYEIFELGTGF
jgi:hypothetical protein